MAKHNPWECPEVSAILSKAAGSYRGASRAGDKLCAYIDSFKTMNPGGWIEKEWPQDAQVFAAVARALNGLGITKLQLSQTLMDIPTLTALLQNLPREIKELTLGGTKLPPEAKAIMAQWAQVNQCKIIVSDQAIKIADGSRQGYHFEDFQCDGAVDHHQGAAAVATEEVLGAPGGPAFVFDDAAEEVLGASSKAACASGNSLEN